MLKKPVNCRDVWLSIFSVSRNRTKMATTEAQAVTLGPELQINVVFTSPTEASSSSLPTLVFLHFWGGSSSTFSKVVEQFSSTYPTISLDFRGWGRSTGPTDKTAYSIAHLASDVETVLQDLDSKGDTKYILIGHSMGGKVAQLVAGRKHLSTVVGLVLVAPAPPRPFQLPEHMRETQIHAYDSRESAEFVVRNVLTASELDDSTVAALTADMVSGSAEARAAWPAYGMAEDVMEWASNIDIPVLVVGAEEDQVEPVVRLKSEVCEVVKNARLVVLQGGHLIPVENPRKLFVEILKFVSELDS